jgi:hypothetical protein
MLHRITRTRDQLLDIVARGRAAGFGRGEWSRPHVPPPMGGTWTPGRGLAGYSLPSQSGSAANTPSTSPVRACAVCDGNTRMRSKRSWALSTIRT